MLIVQQSIFNNPFCALDDGPSVTPQDQLAAERHALKLILTMFATMLRYSVPDLDLHRNGDSKNRTRPADYLPTNVHRSMPALRLSLKWMQVNLHHVKRLTDGLSQQERAAFKLDQIWDDLATFLNLLADVYPYTEDTIFCRDVLKEDAELQGFAALKRSIDERPLSIISPSKISPKAEMQMRVADMFQDALSLGKVEWVEFYGKSVEGMDGNRILHFDTEPTSEDEGDRNEDSADTTVRVFEEPQGASEDDEEETDYEREAADEALNPFHPIKPVPHSTSAEDQQQAVAALLSDEDNDLSLIVGHDDDDDDDEDEDEEEEVVLFTGRKNIMGGKPTPKPAHLKTTGVIGGGRRASMSPTNSTHSSPGLNENGPSSSGTMGGARMNSSPSVDSVFGGFQFGVPDDWRQSISSIRTSRTMEAISPSENTWGGLSAHSLGNGLISPTSYEPRDGSVLNGFGSIPSRGPPGIPFPASPLNADAPSHFADSSYSHHQSRQPMYAPHVRPRYQYQSPPQQQQQQQQQHQEQHEYLQRGRPGTAQHQVIQDRDWR
jgi:hypothetical protein